jgi:hypothetical protein
MGALDQIIANYERDEGVRFEHRAHKKGDRYQIIRIGFYERPVLNGVKFEDVEVMTKWFEFLEK